MGLLPTRTTADANSAADINALSKFGTGIILPFGGILAATGFLICDGSAISRTTYAALYAICGDAFGEGDGSTTFSLPDLRGRFLRGKDGSTARDPDAAGRTAMASGGNTGDNIGSVQLDAFQGHYHLLTVPNPTGGGAAVRNVANDGSGTPDAGIAGARADTIVTDGVNGTPRITSESRPLNAYVNFIIKY